MVNAIASFSDWNCKQLESSLLPSKAPCVLRVAVYAYQFFKFCLFLPLAIAFSTISFAVTAVFGSKPEDSPVLAFAKHPVWSPDPAPVPVRPDGEPIKIGFATADIQDSGPDKPQFAETNWGRFFQAHADGAPSLEMLPDTLNHPERVIEECQRLNVNDWRTSISLMPKEGQAINQVELQRYCNFFRTLEDAGIHVMVTLSHFVDPEDLDWTQPESIDRFARYAAEIAGPLHDAGVTQILTFNEIMVRVLQGHLFGKFPPFRTFDLEGGCKMVENMMRAHLKAYKEIHAVYPEFEIGLTHDPIRFRNSHKCNPLWAPQEKIFAHYLTEITHSAYMRFLLTGKFELKVPFLANESFEIPEFAEKDTRFY
jgi:beta-glucosidase/6-phospho-beta-glucosidase/beta-galactosidase